MSRDDGIRFLTERISEVERERDELQAKSQQLEVLQRSFVEIAAARDERELARAALRGGRLGLACSRALWFRTDDDVEVTALYEADGADVVESEYGGTLPEPSALARVVRGESDVVTGWATDDDAPLFDTRRRYAAAAVRPSVGCAFVLYVDGSNDRSNATWIASSLRELATQAAFSLERQRLASELERLAMHDPLTGLLNRRALMDRVRAALALRRRSGESLAFAMIDVDDFKRINDSRGHAGGDEALKRLAEVLRANVREIDVPARFAGDEFALLMPRTEPATIEAVMSRIYAQLAAHDLRCSIGIAFARGDDSLETLFAHADAAVYAAKAAGKNAYRVAPDSP
ncbi:MAG: GGDEF domain-containing protein [bacterium]|nr:GGDEF domain-containing protein [bacterium]